VYSINFPSIQTRHVEEKSNVSPRLIMSTVSAGFISETAAEIVGGLIGGLALMAVTVMVFFWKPCKYRTQYGTANITAV
jgi:hypothetical protein